MTGTSRQISEAILVTGYPVILQTAAKISMEAAQTRNFIDQNKPLIRAELRPT